MDALLGRASSRFVFVTLLPTLLLLAFIAGLLACGAPAHTPTLSALADHLNALTWRESVALLFVVVIAAVALHPLQTPLIQVLEGYWLSVPGGGMLSEKVTARYERLSAKLRSDENAQPTDRDSFRRASSARFRLDWLPDDNSKFLPTSLGNTLRAGEERATTRYGLEVSIALPRLLPLVPADTREQLADRRTQLDASARLCAMSLVCAIASIGLLLPTGHWLYIPLVAFLFAWAAYRAAIAAARGYCMDLAATVDLHHRELWRALSLEAPDNLLEEHHQAELLMAFLSGRLLKPSQAKSIVWQKPVAPPGT